VKTSDVFNDLVQDLMETDLHRIIYSRQQLTIDHVQYFVYQILRGLKYIHSANVLHRDLKPSNLLVNSNCDLKICDFGLARGVEDEQSGNLTEYVVTRWYRAPEIMLACQEYTKAIDVWSVGCIFAELLARQPLFPGEDYIAQLRLIYEKLGRPPESDLDFITSDRAKRFISSLTSKDPTPMAELFPSHRGETDALDLLSKMLIFHPAKRISVEKTLEHPFMASLHNPDDEPSADFTFSFAFENEELSRERVQELIWEEIRELHPDISEAPPITTPRRRPSSAKADADAKADAKIENGDKRGGSDTKASRKRSISPEPSMEK
jgi:mitogen-activated protein kinase 1/3